MSTHVPISGPKFRKICHLVNAALVTAHSLAVMYGGHEPWWLGAGVAGAAIGFIGIET